MVLTLAFDHMVSSSPIFLLVLVVYHDKDEIKSAQKTRCDASIGRNIVLWVPLLSFQKGICSSNDSCSSVDLAYDACLSH